ncbi:DUF2332 domain-containing protein [Phaeobacter inhibens]|uniref:DUF2332 domain-containing protein n=1 Tax=Phaeobacter inhibens TaxID=221822 RepID=UPI0021A286F4|nr:DUF2332 domain-containing protein [Phaeobacter inhibens]UWS07458.1 DUF2332 domain-containing protein [Phaeobacter inhibens]
MTRHIAERYIRFAQLEAAGQSPIYERLALHVARSQNCLSFLSTLPADRQQPNLLFAAVRHVAGNISGPEAFDRVIRDRAEEVATVMRRRTTQTNEPGRCAVLLPLLAQITGPIALIEVGASAGLCLLPDVYGYDWGDHKLPPPPEFADRAPIFQCNTSPGTPRPMAHPDIIWRVGLDLNPLDVSRDADVAWLEQLVWPEHQLRLDRLQSAVSVAQCCPPRLVAGDLTQDLPALIAEAPANATVVVFHTAVLTYVADQQRRDAFARNMLESDAIWISNEGPRVFPQFAARAGQHREDMFLLMQDGQPLAWTGPHGQQIAWLSATQA